MSRTFLSGLMLLLWVAQRLLYAAAGDLDPSFGNGGRVMTDLIGSMHDRVNAGIVQQDGSIVLVGSFHRKPAVVRLLSNGNVDFGFGDAGKTVVTGSYGEFLGVTVQNDGKILAAGYLGVDTGVGAVLARFNVDGSLDFSFGMNGIATLSVDRLNNFVGVASLADGKIVAVGNTGYSDEGSAFYQYLLARFSSDGTLDTSFGVNGYQLALGCEEDDYASSLLVQSNGKFLVAGSTDCETSYGGSNLGLVRFNSDGSLDSSFGNAGEVITDFPQTYIAHTAIASRPDGKIIVAAGTYRTNNRAKIVIAQYDWNGKRDAGFGDAGKAILPVADLTDFAGLLIHADGAMTVAGSVHKNKKGPVFALWRFSNNGKPDLSFGSRGVVLTPVTGHDHASALLSVSDNSFIVAGSVVPKSKSDFDIGVVKYQNKSELDRTFGIQGKTITGFESSGDQGASGIALQQDGKIIVVGSSKTEIRLLLLARYLPNGELDATYGAGGLTSDWIGDLDELNGFVLADRDKVVIAGVSDGQFLARYDSNGFLDPEFGSGGIAKYSYGGYCRLQDFSIQNDQKIVGAGFCYSAPAAYLVARFNSNGSPDGSFGNGGFVETRIGTGSYGAYASAVAIQPDQKIVVAGILDEISQLALVRYDQQGTLDSSFGSGGVVLTDLPSCAVAEIKIQPDGKILISGSAGTGGSGTADFALLRYQPDGLLDTTFANGGIAMTDFAGEDDQSADVAIRPDGKILVAGVATVGGAARFGLAQYDTSGFLDLSFGTGGKITTSFVSGPDYAYGVNITSAGQILVAGSAYADSNTFDFALARYNAGAIDLLPASIPQAVPGVFYSQTITASGGTPPYVFSVAAGNLPRGLNLSSAGVLSGVPASGGIFVFTIQAIDATTTSGAVTYKLHSLLMHDDFEDGILTWNADPAFWLESNGVLSGTSGWALAPLPWNPSGNTACSVCAVESNVAVSASGKASLVGWYQDRDNYVELSMDQAKSRWILKQRLNGNLVARKKATTPIAPEDVYQVSVWFDGITFHVRTNGVEILSLDSAGGVSGNFGFRVEKNTAAFSSITVY